MCKLVSLEIILNNSKQNNINKKNNKLSSILVKILKYKEKKIN